jgi:16S rRNA (cytosine1402-N4)-methyltransferase
MALRMLVNDELGVIERMLPQAFSVLAGNGRLAIISFHEGEDRLVKHFLKQLEEENKGESTTKRPIEATQEEIASNPRSRSAKLRVFVKKI